MAEHTGRRPRIVPKVFGYITQVESGHHQLLVFSHPDAPEAGIQVPAGTQLATEDAVTGALREAREETGLTGLSAVALIGTQRFDMRPYGRDELHDRTFVHLTHGGTSPQRWRHPERHPHGEIDQEPILFELYWVDLIAMDPKRIADHGHFIPELRRRLAG